MVTDPERGDPVRVTSLSLSVHAGTHVDAPNHVGEDRAGIETLSLEALIGPALVVPARRGGVGAADIARLAGRATRILFRGSPVISPEAARAMIARGVLLVGTDGLSIDPIGDDTLPAHHLLLRARVVILEGLDLAKAPPGRYHLIALPLLIPGADGAPARAVLKPPAARAQRRK